jgi:hypothetical protein
LDIYQPALTMPRHELLVLRSEKDHAVLLCN